MNTYDKECAAGRAAGQRLVLDMARDGNPCLLLAAVREMGVELDGRQIGLLTAVAEHAIENAASLYA